MLRIVLGSGRERFQANLSSSSSSSQDDDLDATSDEHVERWVEWIRRTTRENKNHMDAARLGNWVKTCRRRKWRAAAGVVAAHSQSSP